MGARQLKIASMQAAYFSRQVLEGLLTSSVGFAVFDRWFRYRLVNEALAAMHRVPAQAHAGESLRKITGDAALIIEPAFHAVFATGKIVSGVEVIGNFPKIQAAGHWTGNYFPIRDEREKVTQVGAFVVEVGSEVQHGAAITANKKLFETLILNTNRTQELLSRLLPRNEHGLTRADSAGIIAGVTKAIGKCESRPENGSSVILSPREQEIVCFLASGKSNKEIASALNISVKTVETHRARIFLKLHLDSVASLVCYAIRNKMVEL